MRQTLWKLYTSNEDAWKAMLLACEEAKESIDLEQFIFVTDEFGNKLIDICERKAKEGVKIRFIWDAAGSFSLFGEGIIEDLKSKGIELVFFKTFLPEFFKIHKYKSWYFKNHRRALIIDEKVGFTGSICISEIYKNWRDTNVRIEGLVVKDMQRTFDRMWDRAQRKRLPRIKKGIYHDSEFKYITNSPIPGHRRLYRHILEAIHSSKKYIYITTPYFVPTHRLLHALKSAALSEIDIRIIIPEWSDHPIVDLASRTFFHQMLSSGVKIFLYKGNMIHSKTILIDGNWASVGTMNMDNISLLYNFEANLITDNKRFSEELFSHFIRDMRNSEEITLEKWNNRFWVEKFSGFFIRLIRDFL